MSLGSSSASQVVILKAQWASERHIKSNWSNHKVTANSKDEKLWKCTRRQKLVLALALKKSLQIIEIRMQQQVSGIKVLSLAVTRAIQK